MIFFGVVSAIVNTVGLIPYVRDILKGKTKPERATWWIWLTLGTIALTAQISAGAKWSLAMTGAQTLAAATIAILSVKFGFGKFHKKDFISLIVAFFGIVLWKLTDSPLSALLIVIFVDFLAFYLTITKTWSHPETETLISWVLASISGFAGLLAVGEWNFTKAVYPLYMALGNGFLAWVIFSRRKAKI